MRFCSLVLLSSCLVLGSASLAAAQEQTAAPRIQTAFDRPFAIGVYGSGWLGAYAAAGGGGRLRWEPFDLLGVEVFGEGHVVEWPGAIRHDHQLGFNLYVPIVLVPEVRLRPLFGFCTVLSMIESGEDHAPRADDVLFGVHAGVGVEWAIGTWFSVFFDVQATAWMGHDRTARGWTANLGGDYVPYGTVQGLLGVMVHLGD
jgi:hypothetical protein